MEKNRDSMMQTLKFEVLHMEKEESAKQGKEQISACQRNCRKSSRNMQEG